jgi:hypothetical protein
MTVTSDVALSGFDFTQNNAFPNREEATNEQEERLRRTITDDPVICAEEDSQFAE